jgi:hypothetical protein
VAEISTPKESRPLASVMNMKVVIRKAR